MKEGFPFLFSLSIIENKNLLFYIDTLENRVYYYSNEYKRKVDANDKNFYRGSDFYKTLERDWP